MSAPCFVEKQSNSVYRKLTNNSGAALVDGEFTLLGKFPVCANGAISSTATGSFVGVCRIQANDFVASEDTFGTANAPAYWDPSTKTFSDTKTATYYEVGQVAVVKTGGVVMIDLYSEALKVPVMADMIDVLFTSLGDGEILKYTASTALWENKADAT